MQSEGRDRPVCSSCGKTIYVNPVPAAAVVVIRSGDVLITRRAMEPKKGEWCLPGGFIEWGESPAEGAAREVLEETNLVVNGLDLIGVYDSISPLGIQVIVIAYAAGGWSGEPVPGDDAAETVWFSLDDVPSLAFSVHERALADFRARHTVDTGKP